MFDSIGTRISQVEQYNSRALTLPLSEKKRPYWNERHVIDEFGLALDICIREKVVATAHLAPENSEEMVFVWRIWGHSIYRATYQFMKDEYLKAPVLKPGRVFADAKVIGWLGECPDPDCQKCMSALELYLNWEVWSEIRGSRRAVQLHAPSMWGFWGVDDEEEAEKVWKTRGLDRVD